MMAFSVKLMRFSECCKTKFWTSDFVVQESMTQSNVWNARCRSLTCFHEQFEQKSAVLGLEDDVRNQKYVRDKRKGVFGNILVTIPATTVSAERPLKIFEKTQDVQSESDWPTKTFIVRMLIKHSHLCFPVSLYYYSNILVPPYVFGTLTTPAYFHRFQSFRYQNHLCYIFWYFSLLYFLKYSTFIKIFLSFKWMGNAFNSSSSFQLQLLLHTFS